MAAGVEWGTKNAPDRRGSEVSAKIKTISATSVSCRPIQYINATPVSLAIYPAQVLIVSIASASISASTNQTQRHMEILENRLCWSERLVRMSVSTSFQTNASVHSTNAPIQIRQFLLPPIFLLSESRFTVPKTQYNSFWPNQAIRPVNDALSLQQLLDTGNDQTNTLVVLAHQGCNILGWMGWAKQMSCMSEMSSFGIAYRCDSSLYFPFILNISCSADHDVKFCRDNTVFGRHGLDYIISLSNRSLQAFAHYLSRLDHHVYVSCSFNALSFTWILQVSYIRAN
jgi:hypothetical protein